MLFVATAAGTVAFAGRLERMVLPPVLRLTMNRAAQFPIRLALFPRSLFALLGASLGLDPVLRAYVAGMVMHALLANDQHEELMQQLSTGYYAFSCRSS